MRTPKWRFAVGDGRQQPRSLAERQHPSRSSHERPDPIAHCGRPSKRERVGPTPTRHTRQRTHRFIGVKPDLAHALRSGCRHLSPFAPVGRARIARQAWAAHRWAIGIWVLRSFFFWNVSLSIEAPLGTPPPDKPWARPTRTRVRTVHRAILRLAGVLHGHNLLRAPHKHLQRLCKIWSLVRRITSEVAAAGAAATVSSLSLSGMPIQCG